MFYGFQEEVLIENTYESAPMVNEIFWGFAFEM